MNEQLSESQPVRRPRTSQEEVEAKEQELQKQEKEGHHSHTRWGTICLAYSSLGIIYGDIGTSPLYCFATTLYSLKQPQLEDVMGVASLIFWIMTLIVLVKYVLIVLRADDNGEGGTFALYSLLCRSIGLTPFGAEVEKSDVQLSRYSSVPKRAPSSSSRTEAVARWMTGKIVNRSMRHAFRHTWGLQMALLLTVVLATAMVVGDGILTPSISVMGAVEGLTVATDNIDPAAITGISCVVLVLLFVGQRYGTSMVGQAFAPVVIIWLGMNAILGIYNLSTYGGSIFKSLSPWYVVNFFRYNGHHGWLMLGGVILCITGAEAMYSDLGHFNRQAISLGFISYVYPTLMLTYWGQGAFLLTHPEYAKETFWKSVPDNFFWPFFVMAILASVVASQALISGAFSNMRQASALGLFPKMTIIHTGRTIEGQIYMPEVNYTLMVLCVAVTVGFESTHQLGEAYGVAVMTVMTITTMLVCLVMLMTWNLHPLLVALFCVVYLPLEGAFLSATLVKVPNGGWVALVVAVILGALKMTWWWGTNNKHQHNIRNKSHIYDMLMEVDRPVNVKLGSFRCSMLWNKLISLKLPRRQVVLVATREPVSRMPGLGVYYSEASGGVPAVMQHVLETMPVLYSSMVFMTVRFVAVPAVDKSERFLIRRDKTISSCYHVTIRYGYLDRVDHSQMFMEDLVQALLQHLLEKKGIGSSGAAQRLLDCISAKAAAKQASDAGFDSGDMYAVSEGFDLYHAKRDGSATANPSNRFKIAATLSAAARAVSNTIGSNSWRPSPGDTSNVVSELLAGLTAAELLAILQPVSMLSSRRISSNRLLPAKKRSTSSMGASTECVVLSGSGAVADGQASVTLKGAGEPAVATGSKQVGFSEPSSADASGLRRRASAKLPEDDSTGSESTAQPPRLSQLGADSAREAAEPTQGADSVDSAESEGGRSAADGLKRVPSYWGQLHEDGNQSEDEHSEDQPEVTEQQLDGQQRSQLLHEDEQTNQQQQQQQPDQLQLKPISVPAVVAISDIMSPVSLSNSMVGGNNSNSKAAGVTSEASDGSLRHRLAASGKPAADPTADGNLQPLVQLSTAQITALQESVRVLEDYHRRWVHCVGRTTLKVLPGAWSAHKVLLGGLYRFMATNSRQVTSAWNIPTKNLIELGMDVEV